MKNPDRRRNPGIFAEPSIWPDSISTGDLTSANHVDVLTVRSVSSSFQCPYQHTTWSPASTGKPAPKWTMYFFVDGHLAELIKRSASDRLGDFSATGFVPGLLHGFSRHGASRPWSWNFLSILPFDQRYIIDIAALLRVCSHWWHFPVHFHCWSGWMN